MRWLLLLGLVTGIAASGCELLPERAQAPDVPQNWKAEVPSPVTAKGLTSENAYQRAAELNAELSRDMDGESTP